MSLCVTWTVYASNNIKFRILASFVCSPVLVRACFYRSFICGHQPKMCQICLKISWNKSWQVPNATAVCVWTARINPFAVNIINGSDGEATLFQFTATFKRRQLYHFVLRKPNKIMHARTHQPNTGTRPATALSLDSVFGKIFLDDTEWSSCCCSVVLMTFGWRSFTSKSRPFQSNCLFFGPF